MAPVAVDYHPAKGYMLVHHCTACAFTGRNRTAGDDDLDLILKIMQYG